MCVCGIDHTAHSVDKMREIHREQIAQMLVETKRVKPETKEPVYMYSPEYLAGLWGLEVGP